jgi:hypothetical protein
LSIARYWGTDIHAVYSMSRMEVKLVANGLCGWLPGLEAELGV